MTKEGETGGERKKGRPGLRRMAGVELDLRNVGLKLWRTRTLGEKKNRMGSCPESRKERTHMAVALKKKKDS